MSTRYTGLTHHPKAVLGRRKDGRPIHPIAGGSVDAGTETVVVVPDPGANAPVPPSEQAPEGRFTAADIEKARKEEKDKVYADRKKWEDQAKTFEQELTLLRQEREEKAAAEAVKEADKEAARKAKFEDEASAKELLKAKEKEWEERFAASERERQEERVLLDKEKQYLALRDYTQRRVAEVQDTIAPELLDLISGDTPETVEASIATLQAKSAAILKAVQDAQNAARAQVRGVSSAGYGTTGPLENEPGTKQFTLDDLKNMSMAEYSKYRQGLLGASSKGNTGMYG